MPENHDILFLHPEAGDKWSVPGLQSIFDHEEEMTCYYLGQFRSSQAGMGEGEDEAMPQSESFEM